MRDTLGTAKHNPCDDPLGYCDQGTIAEDRLDANRDGRIQRSELSGQFPGGEQLFNRFDENKDGVLDKVELEAARGRMNRLRDFRGGRR